MEEVTRADCRGIELETQCDFCPRASEPSATTGKGRRRRRKSRDPGEGEEEKRDKKREKVILEGSGPFRFDSNRFGLN
ncbi:hypothetical protein JCGZ_22224 [Jatropha curcas]|uniref:Uncharacterized protein n=1 Tax=Jatropha curcas TaxID=180498 RepID=A0A067JTH4_JATCU|nr:hypothetical protein JCGZ_22224 [Jatropha curcas]